MAAIFFTLPAGAAMLFAGVGLASDALTAASHATLCGVRTAGLSVSGAAGAKAWAVTVGGVAAGGAGAGDAVLRRFGSEPRWAVSGVWVRAGQTVPGVALAWQVGLTTGVVAASIRGCSRQSADERAGLFSTRRSLLVVRTGDSCTGETSWAYKLI
jgi:hypothetical protein